MNRKPNRRAPVLEPVEPRVLLSNASELLSPHQMHAVVREVKSIVGTIERTHNVARAGDRLDRLAASIPSGASGLAPIWRRDLERYRPRHPASAIMAKRRIIVDFHRFVRNPILPPAPSPPPPIPGPPGAPAPPTASSLDSVRIRNATGISLRVTVVLQVPQVQKPSITRTIPVRGGSTLPFDFGTRTNAFMTISVRRADGRSSPPQLNTNLPQPMNGYNGAMFTVSLLGPYFNVSAG